MTHQYRDLTDPDIPEITQRNRFFLYIEAPIYARGRQVFCGWSPLQAFSSHSAARAAVPAFMLWRNHAEAMTTPKEDRQ